VTRSPDLLIVLAILSVQAGSSLAAALVRDHAPATVVALRLLVAAAVLVAFLRPVGRGATPGAIRRAALLGVVMVVMNSLFYAAIARTPLGVVVTIEFWGPLAVAVAGSRRPRDLLWVVMAATGIWLLGAERLTGGDPVGVILALIAGGCWALFIVIGVRVTHDWPASRGLAISTATAAAIAVPLAVAGGAVGELRADPALLVGGLVVGLFASVIPWVLEFQAMKAVTRATFGILMSLEPAVAAILGWLLLAQGLSQPEAAGVALVIGASAGASATGPALPEVPGELET
jgi:inner membrane transporter RhtA